MKTMKSNLELRGEFTTLMFNHMMNGHIEPLNHQCIAYSMALICPPSIPFL